VTLPSIVSKDNIMQMYVIEAQTEPDKWEPITIHMTLGEAIDDYNLFRSEMRLRITTYTRTGLVSADPKPKAVSTECN
jgi:hypothetical protein